MQIFLYSNELAERGKKKMEKKNILFTKDGAKVSVKEVSAEDYADKTQRAFVKTWNAAQEELYAWKPTRCGGSGQTNRAPGHPLRPRDRDIGRLCAEHDAAFPSWCFRCYVFLISRYWHGIWRMVWRRVRHRIPAESPR